MPSSTQHKLSKVRPPRVQITYDVEVGDDIQMKELPLVVGVLSDLSGQSVKTQPKLKDRKFVDIDAENFDSVMSSIQPRIELSVDNKLTNENTRLNLALDFNKIDDFNPLHVVKKIPVLKSLYEARSHLVDLLGKLDGNDRLDELLTEIVQNSPDLEQIRAASIRSMDEAAAEKGEKADDTTPDQASDHEPDTQNDPPAKKK